MIKAAYQNAQTPSTLKQATRQTTPTWVCDARHNRYVGTKANKYTHSVAGFEDQTMPRYIDDTSSDQTNKNVGFNSEQ